MPYLVDILLRKECLLKKNRNGSWINSFANKSLDLNRGEALDFKELQKFMDKWK